MEDLDDAKSSLKCECTVLKKQFLRKFDGIKKEEKLMTTEILLRYAETLESARVITVILTVAVVSGYSTATVENVFSARQRIDSRRRRKLTPYKQGNLTLLHFEKQITKSVTFDEFLAVWKRKPRRLRI